MDEPGTDDLHEALAAHLYEMSVGDAPARGRDTRRPGDPHGSSDSDAPARERAASSPGAYAREQVAPGPGVAPGSGVAPDPYRVERVLKESPSEVTQLVWYRGADGSELGPFVRKLFAAASGLGGAYRELAAAQRTGRRFPHLPRIVECREQCGGDGSPHGAFRRCLVVVMEYVPGFTLREVIEGARPERRERLAACLMPALCDAAIELHEAFDTPLIHRDLTPGNIICPEGDPTSPVLIDLGIARSWHEGASSDTTHFGTKAYAPPEQYGFGQTDVRSDVFSLGLVAFFCLTGRDPSPRDRDSFFAAPGVPKSWRVTIARAAAYDPGSRFANAHELKIAFEHAALGGEGVAAQAEREGRDTTPQVEGASHAVTAAPGEPNREPELVVMPAHSAAAGSRVHLPARPGVQPLASSGVPQVLPSASRIPGAGMRPSGAPAVSGPQPPAAPVGAGPTSFQELRRRVLAFASRVPEPVGIVWNVLLVALYLLLVIGCVANIARPNALDANLPTWYLVVQYGVWMPVLTGAYLYLFLDRRRIRRRFSWLGKHTVLQETGVCLGIMFGSAILLTVTFNLL